MKFDRSNKFDLCYYGQVNTFGGNTYFASDDIYIYIYIYIYIAAIDTTNN